MTARERFLATVRLEPVDRPLLWECGFWTETLERWRGEGLQRAAAPHPSWVRLGAGDVAEALAFDEHYLMLPVETRNLVPGFTPQILEEHAEWVVRRNSNGSVEKEHKSHAGIRCITEPAVCTRDDWERIKAEHMDRRLESRAPPNFEDLLRQCPTATGPIRGIQCEPWLLLGELVGPDRLLELTIEDPEFLDLMMADLTELYLSLTDQLLRRMVPDLCWLGGDFCYKSGPLMSPAAFRRFLYPGFRAIADLYRRYGVPAILVHTDGDCRPLIPDLIRAGATGVHPFEVTNGQTVVGVRQAFPRFHIFGGIDKRLVARGPEAIDGHLREIIPFMAPLGGYVPHLDHAVPPSISWEHFVYYRRRLEELVQG